jgi:streptogramin lyase
MDKNTDVWFAVLGKDGSIGRVNTETGKLSQWPTPNGSAQRIHKGADGMVLIGPGFFDPPQGLVSGKI